METSRPARASVARSIAGGLALFLAAIWIGMRVPRFGDTPQSADRTRDEAILAPGRQILFVYVGSSRCGPSNAPGVAENVAAGLDSVGQWARGKGLGFVSIGVAREWSASEGLSHLAKVGGFDEIAAGQSGLNQAAAHFISRDLRGIAATPQVIVVSRTLRSVRGSVDFTSFDERVLLRKVGTQEIRSWVAAGAPVPFDAPARTSAVSYSQHVIPAVASAGK